MGQLERELHEDDKTLSPKLPSYVLRFLIARVYVYTNASHYGSPIQPSLGSQDSFRKIALTGEN